jgi:hypothetical protein
VKIFNIFFPKYLNKKIESFLKKEKFAEKVETKINSSISNLLKGKIDLEIKAKNLKVKDLNLKSLKGKFKEINFDFPEFFRKREIKIKSIKAEDVEIKITEEDLESYLNKEDSFKNFKLSLEPDIARISGKVNFLGRDLDVVILGKFEISEKQKIKFKGKQIKISKYILPSNLTQEIMGKISPEVDLKSLKIPLNLKKIKIKKGYLQIEASII